MSMILLTLLAEFWQAWLQIEDHLETGNQQMRVVARRGYWNRDGNRAGGRNRQWQHL